MRYDESVSTGYTRTVFPSDNGEVNARIFTASWNGFALSVASSFVIVMGAGVAQFNEGVAWTFIGVGVLFIITATRTTYTAINIAREDADAERKARYPPPRETTPGAQWSAPFPTPPFIEYLYTLTKQGDKVPPVRDLTARFPTAQDYLAQMDRAGAIIGRKERGDGGTLIWSLERSLDAAKFANPSYTPSPASVSN